MPVGFRHILIAFRHVSDKWFDCIDRGGTFREFVPYGYSKATGIQYVLNHYHLNLAIYIRLLSSAQKSHDCGMSLCDMKNIIFIAINVCAATVPYGYSKATGIQYVLNHYHLNLADAYAFGDSNNDLSMLSYVPHSIAMGNASPKSLFTQVEYVTAKSSCGGIQQALQHYGFL